MNNKGELSYEKQESFIVHQFHKIDRVKISLAGKASTSNGVIVTINNLDRNEIIMDSDDKIYSVIEVDHSPIGLNKYTIRAEHTR